MSKPGHGMIGLDQLERMIETGEIDTVVIAFCDMQGRLVGKRHTGAFFLEHGTKQAAHFCTYLLGTDMEMNTPDGYALTNWNTGYGDWLARPDWTTLRVIAWQEQTALVLADVEDERAGTLVPIAPRTILKSQVERARALGFEVRMASELEFYLFRDTFDEAHAKGYDDLQRVGWYNEDYQLLQGARAEPFYRRLRNEMTAAGIPVECSKGEAAPGQHEVNIRYSTALESADRHALFKHGAKEIALQSGYALTFMAKPHHDWTGSSGHIHLSLWDTSGGTNVFADLKGSTDRMSATMRYFLGGLMVCARPLSVFQASTINAYKRYAVASWAPVNVVWGRDNRTGGYRVVGEGTSLRIENRFPGGDANPYLAYAAMIAAGLYGIEQQIEPPAEYTDNGYLATGVSRIPRSLVEAIDALASSEMARAAFGADVVDHYLTMARLEQAAFDAAVTDWERYRYFERG